MTLLEIAQRDRRGKSASEDAILKPCIAILILNEKLQDRFDQVKELCQVGIDEETGLPKVLDFATETDEAKAEVLQDEISGFQKQKAELMEIVTEMESIFARYECNTMSMEGIEARLAELQEAPLTLARRLNNLIVKRIRADPTIHFAKLLTDPDVLELETARTRAISGGLAEQSTLEKLKSEVSSICIRGEPLYRQVKYAYREERSNPATVSLLQGNDQGLEEDLEEYSELNRMDAAL